MSLKATIKRDLQKYTGDFSQVFGIKEYTLSGGKAAGVKSFDFRNGSGLEFTVLSDRCLDIAGLSFKSTNFAYISKAGVVAPQYYNPEDPGFLRNFFGGFLTTCGLRNVGNGCEVDGEKFGAHGRIGNSPAEEVCASVNWEGGIPQMVLSGKIREARMFGENMVLTRKITCQYGENKILLQNTVENCGFKTEPLLLLFHFNMGYPLLDENSILITPTEKLNPRDPEAAKGKDDYFQCLPPTPDYAEQVFYHQLKAEPDGNTCVAMINQELGIGVAIHFNKNQLFNFTQWKQMGEGEYVMGMEPCNCFVGGRANATRNNLLEFIGPGETRNFDLTIEILNGATDIDTLVNYIKSM